MKRLLPALCVLGLALLGARTSYAQPANDNFASAWTLTGTVATTNGNSGQTQQGIPNATKETGEPNHAGLPGGRSVWFNWTAPTNGQTRVDTLDSGFNTLLAVYTGTAVNALTLVASNDNISEGFGGNSRSRLEFHAVAGTTYRIAIDGRGGFSGQNPASGPYVLNLRVLASVFIATPTNGTVVSLGTTIPIHVEASVPNATVTRVDLYRTGGLLGSLANPPYDFQITSPPSGTNSFVAIAVDNAGLSWTSAVVNVAVLSIGLNLVSPPDGAVFQTTNPITVSALALLQSGAMTNVEFFVDGQKFGQDATAPFSAAWTSVTSGAHRFTATGRDNAGNTHVAAPVSIAVVSPLVRRGSNWKYLDNGTDQGTNWSTLGFDDSSWTNGPAELGYGDGDEATVVGFGGNPENVFITTYFRHSFVLTNAAYAGLLMNVKRDDGAVVYVNGVEIARFNMNPGPVLFDTFALNAQDDGANFFPASALANMLVEGTNVLAVEIHQTTVNSSDISFEMDLSGVPTIIRNESPVLTLDSPTNNAPFLAPSAILLQASAADPDGSVTNVEFYANNVKLGNVTQEPYELAWNSPPIGLHTLRVVATDNQGASTSVQISVAAYDAVGNPLVEILSPAHGSVFDGPTNLILSARVTALSPVVDVLFLTNGVDLLTDPDSPYSVVWTNAAFGTNILSVWAADSNSRIGYSPDITVVVIAPPINTVAPTITARVPTAGITVTSLTSIAVTFSERVINVDAADLLVNGVPATNVTGSVSNYTFTFRQPPYGEEEISWAANHGITDIGYPSNLAFNANGPGAGWNYILIDAVPPTVASRSPAAGATVTNLTQIGVTFSEPVGGVNASDLLINGTPAVGLSGGGSNYSFSFAQPAGGTVAITWAGAHGIADFADTPNPFNSTGPGATWSYTLDLRTVLVQSNSTWRFVKGFAEASAPIDAWRQFEFDDSGWSNAPAPFFYGDTTFTNAANPGTAVNDMLGGAYSSIYFRKAFNVVGASSVTNLFLVAAIDDGAIVWINGTEVLRNNMAPGDIPYNGSAPTAANEPGNNGVAYTSFTLANANAYLVEGPNVIAVHAFNNQPTTSSDFCWNAQLYAFVLDPSQIPPRVSNVTPAAGSVFYLTNITVRFTEPISGVDPGDLLVNGVPATDVTSTTNTTYTFSFAQPPFGPVNVTWAAGHGIADLDSPPKPFDGAAAGATFQYSLINPSAPTIALQTPLAGSSVATLTQIVVHFSEPVTGVDAADLRINGAPAVGLSDGGAAYTFTFPQPPYGSVSVGWITGHGITDIEPEANPFDSTRPGSAWSYTLVDQVQPTLVSRTPPAGAVVTNLTQLSVTFSEAVTGVNASDLLINGAPASSLNGSGAGPYTFTFPQPNATLLSVTWANSHGIRDLAPVPNSFDATGPGAIWSYTTPDTLAPSVAVIDPPPFVTLRSLTRIAVTFTEPVIGVDTNDLLLNNRRAISVNGSGAGPYSFNFLPASNGVAEVRWVAGHLISDLATPLPNSFGGGEWNYVVDPAATFAGKVLVSEIMFHPSSDLLADEWVELHNVTSNFLSLAGWRFARGADFTFPNVAIPAGGYLVVAADTNAFRARYPAVSNVIGNWSGRLANSDETLELVTPLGESVNTVHYATEGDWATRARGRPAQRVTSITLAGTTATVTVPQHGYNNNETVFITGANQPEYNGRFNISNPGNSTFTITVQGAPASPATGAIVCRHIVDNGASGWSWYSAADGFGSSLELVNAALPGEGLGSGQNWAASTNLQGTPGSPNSARATNVAPFILDAAHSPPVPRSTNDVTISARVLDELSNGVASVTLFWRNHSIAGPGPFTSAPMFDDGAHKDGVANDRLYAGTIPAQTNRTVIEFYIQASDTLTLTRTWPAPAWQTNNTYAQNANALFQVDDQSSSTNMPFLRLVLTETERAEFAGINQASDAEMNATFISLDGDGTKVRYGCGLRIRGQGSRNGNPKNWRLNIPTDNRWNGLSEINLNSRFIHAQLSGSVLAQKAGLPVADGRIVQVRLNGNNLVASGTPPNTQGSTGGGFGAYILVEPINGDFAANHFPTDGQGNAYRASSGSHDADLASGGMNVDFYYTRGYSKTSNQSDNDWTDMASLTAALSSGLPDASYVQAVRTNVNVQLWMRYFAVCAYFGFGETALCNGIGDDYAMYRGLEDPRFILLGHDFDTILGQGDSPNVWPVANTHIWVMLNPPNPNGDPPSLQTTLLRFMRHPEHAPVYFAELKRLADGPFSPAQADPVLDQILSGWGPDQNLTITPMKNTLANRRAGLMSQVPLALTVSNTLATQSGFPFTANPAVTLFGTANAIDTRAVRVNGSLAGWSAWEARWTNTVTLQPGVNRVLVQSFNSNDVEFARATVDIWHDDGSVANVSGALTTDTVWSAANGPYQVTGNLTVNAGATLTIQPGTTVYLSPGVDFTVANGGRLLAEGLDTARIRFSSAPGAGNWGGLTINGGPASPETRIAYAQFEGNSDTAVHATDGTLFLDHLTFGNPAEQYVSLDRSSFVVQDCVFPAITGSFEPTHGTGGIKAGGRGIFRRNFFGRVMGYNDALDFTGGNRPGPILQVLNNVFMGSDDDLLDLDSTDAWVEGNIFLHTHRNGSPDSASAISGGADNADTSQITAVGNLFYDVDHAANAKQGNFYTMVNNTIVHQTKIGSQDTNTAVVILADDTTAQGAGIYLEGNIILDAENLTRNVTTALVTFTNNIIHQLTGAPWTGPGGSNTLADPLLTQIPPFSVTSNFTSWAEAQVLWTYFSPRPGSPASGTGPNGRDKGAVASSPSPLGGERAGVRGVSISGEPVGTTRSTTATLRVGLNRTGNGIPTAGFPDGSGFTHYRWRLDGGAWSAETPTATPISLSSLSSGPHSVEVVGKNDAGFYQNDPVFGSDALVTESRTWTVNPSASPLRLNEILASNGGSVNHFGTTPDVVELHNASDATLDLAGVRITDDLTAPDKFIFPAGANIPARGYLAVYADSAATPGHHLRFTLSQAGGELHVFASALEGGALIDSARFGLQITDLSIGRLADGSWALTQPTSGGANRPAPTGDPRALRINEWLALGDGLQADDFVELYNPQSAPVAIGGLYLSDEPTGWPDRHPIAALSFMPGLGYQRFIADGDNSAGAEHLNFSLSGDQGMLALSSADLAVIDCVVYAAQTPGVSQGRSPNGSATLGFFSTPTPGAPNPLIVTTPTGGALVINEVLAQNASLGEVISGTNVVTPDWVELYNGSTNTANLAGLSLTDNSTQPLKFVFAEGTVLAPGQYLRVVCDTDATNSSPLLNTNFNIGASGGAVYLFDSPAYGGNLLNSITYGLQIADFSIGRVPDGSGNWTLTLPSPNGVNLPATLGNPANLKVNEWLADSPMGEDDWFELYNPDPQPVSLGELALTDDLSSPLRHRIAALSFIGAGSNAWQQFLADGNTGSGAHHVGFSLNAEGEDIGLSFTNNEALINGYSFGLQTPSVSEGRFPDGGTNVVSFPGTASPGASNWRLLTSVVINEVLTHTDEPFEDAIELRNLTPQAIDIGGWWLSDDDGTPQKYQIPSPNVIPADGYTVIYENKFTNRLLAAIPFALSSRGDEVVLSPATNNALTGYRTRVDFGPAANSVSFGRYVTSDGRSHLVAMSERTFGVDDPGNVEEFRTGGGLPNALPRVGPVVITEIMYHPPDLGTNDNDRDEFIELRNITTAPVPLYDSTNSWHLRDAVDFDFPLGTGLAPGAHLLVVGFDPVNNPAALAAFRAVYGLSTNTVVLGPWSGKLANDSEDLELRRPDAPDVDGVPYILVERVRYSDSAPWPVAADGTGFSLQRLAEDQFANDPGNWSAAPPTAGPDYSTLDSDGDGLPDSWESDNGFDPFNPADASLDSDGDGLTNLQEYQLGTDPRNAASGLRLSIALAPGGTSVVLSFTAAANFGYGLEQTDALGTPWQSLQSFAAVPTNRVVQLTVPASAPNRFYRLRIESSPSPDLLRLNSIQSKPGNQVLLDFSVPANQGCTVLFKPTLSAAAWTTVTQFQSASTNRVLQLLTPANGASGFYRLRSP